MSLDNQMVRTATASEGLRAQYENLPAIMFPTRLAVMAAATYNRRGPEVLVREQAAADIDPPAPTIAVPGRQMGKASAYMLEKAKRQMRIAKRHADFTK